MIGAYLDQPDELGTELDGPGNPGVDQERRARGALRRVPPRRDRGPWWCPRSPISPSTFRKPQWPCRFRAPSVPRQEEAQRLGRLLRPGDDGGGAVFYPVVSRDSLDADYAAHRRRFLAEQGYGYIITDADDLLGPAI